MYIRIVELLKQAPLTTDDLLYLLPGVAPSTIYFYLNQLKRRGFIRRINKEYHLQGNKQVLCPCKRCRVLVISWTLDRAGRCKKCQPEKTLSFVDQVFPDKTSHTFAAKLMQTPFRAEELEKLREDAEV